MHNNSTNNNKNIKKAKQITIQQLTSINKKFLTKR